MATLIIFDLLTAWMLRTDPRHCTFVIAFYHSTSLMIVTLLASLTGFDGLGTLGRSVKTEAAGAKRRSSHLTCMDPRVSVPSERDSVISSFNFVPYNNILRHVS